MYQEKSGNPGEMEDIKQEVLNAKKWRENIGIVK
jgi:hypothetical protein